MTLPTWLLRFWMRRDLRRIVDSLSLERCIELRATREPDLIRFHRSLGLGLRNSFRQGRFRGLCAYCHATIRKSGEPLSFDTLSSAAIRELWRFLRSGA